MTVGDFLLSGWNNWMELFEYVWAMRLTTAALVLLALAVVGAVYFLLEHADDRWNLSDVWTWPIVGDVWWMVQDWWDPDGRGERAVRRLQARHVQLCDLLDPDTRRAARRSWDRLKRDLVAYQQRFPELTWPDLDLLERYRGQAAHCAWQQLERDVRRYQVAFPELPWPSVKHFDQADILRRAWNRLRSDQHRYLKEHPEKRDDDLPPIELLELWWNACPLPRDGRSDDPPDPVDIEADADAGERDSDA